MNKKADGKLLSIWWFFVLVIVLVGIVISIAAFNSGDINSKKIEADILVSRVIDCVVDNGYIKQELLGESIFEQCDLSKEIIEDSGLYSLDFELYKYGDCDFAEVEDKIVCENPIKETQANFGVHGFKVLCFQEGKHYPECSEKYIFVSDRDGQKYIFYIIGGSNQMIKTVYVKNDK